MSTVSTHVLDTAAGKPAAGVPVWLSRQDRGAAAGAWEQVASAETDADGRVKQFAANGGALGPGRYCLRFDTGAYHARSGVAPFFPVVEVVFEITGADRHYHVPLLLSPYGYSTYRGT